MDTINEAMNWSAWMAIIWRMHDPVKLKSFVCCRYHHFSFLPIVSLFFSLPLSQRHRSWISWIKFTSTTWISQTKRNEPIHRGGVALVTLLYFVLDRHTVGRLSCSCIAFGTPSHCQRWSSTKSSPHQLILSSNGSDWNFSRSLVCRMFFPRA